MKRDDELLRTILFEIEEKQDFLSHDFQPHLGMTQKQRDRLGHVLILSDAGLVAHDDHAVRLTAAGHDYLDAIRSDGIWNRTKETAASVGGVTLGIMKDIAVAYLRQEVSARLGIAL